VAKKKGGSASAKRAAATREQSKNSNNGATSARATSSTIDPLTERREARVRGRRGVAESQRKRKRNQRIILAIAGVVVLLVAGAFVFEHATTDDSDSRITTGVATATDPGQFITPLPAKHVKQGTKITDYNSDPPTSGNHWPVTAPWGISAEPVDDELLVHNLEHGGIVIEYDCPEGCQDVVDQLNALVSPYPVKLVLAPRANMKHMIAVTAWSRLLTMDELNLDQINAFIDVYIDQGPEKIQTETDALNQMQK
jgi:hypothetical protein